MTEFLDNVFFLGLFIGGFCALLALGCVIHEMFFPLEK